MTFNVTELALILIVGVDVLIVGALVIVRVAGLRPGRPSAPQEPIASGEPVAPLLDEVRRRAIAPVAPATRTAAAAIAPERSEHPTGTPGAADSVLTAESAVNVDRTPDRAADAAHVDLEWQRALRRETARAARYGRSMTLMHFEVDLPVDGDPTGRQLAEADALLAGLIAAQVRVSDHVAHPAAGRYWMLLTETEESAALWVADRIRSQYIRRHPSPPVLLVGWAGTEPGGGIETTLRRAIERVHEDRRRARASLEQQGTTLRPAIGRESGSVDDSMTTLERLWRAGLMTDAEYQRKRTDILGRF